MSESMVSMVLMIEVMAGKSERAPLFVVPPDLQLQLYQHLTTCLHRALWMTVRLSNSACHSSQGLSMSWNIEANPLAN